MGQESLPITGSVLTGEGRQLSTLMWGSGPHLVIVESGIGVSAYYWVPVMQALGPQFRCVAYDRAGIGHSDPDPSPRDLARLATDLRAVIEAHHGESLILVGHSWGGPIIRTALTAGQPPIDGLTGVVLLDPTDEHFFVHGFPLVVKTVRATLTRLCRRQSQPETPASAFDGVPDQLRDRVLAAVSTEAAEQEISAESAHLVGGLLRLMMSGPSAIGVPMIIVSGQIPAGGETARWRTAIRRAHRAAARKAGARLVLAPNSGHLIPLTDPEVIASEVTRIAHCAS